MFGWAVGGSRCERGRCDGPGAGGSAPKRSRSELPVMAPSVLGSGRIELELRGRVGGGEIAFGPRVGHDHAGMWASDAGLLHIFAYAVTLAEGAVARQGTGR
jgi:hypothetical protein